MSRRHVGAIGGAIGSALLAGLLAVSVNLGILRAADFDPPPGDGSEHPEDVSLAIDGNPDSAWATDHYASATFGNLKAGVGLFLDLGSVQTVDRLTLNSA